MQKHDFKFQNLYESRRMMDYLLTYSSIFTDDHQKTTPEYLSLV